MPKLLVALVGEGGQEIGSKPRSTLTATDTFHGVFVLLVTPSRQLVVSTLPGTPQKFGVAAIALRAPDETPDAAATRALPACALHHLGDQLHHINGRPVYASAYYAVRRLPAENTQHLAISLADLDARTAAGSAVLTHALAAMLATYRHLLPL